jgi:hypothetical protein
MRRERASARWANAAWAGQSVAKVPFAARAPRATFAGPAALVSRTPATAVTTQDSIVVRSTMCLLVATTRATRKPAARLIRARSSTTSRTAEWALAPISCANNAQPVSSSNSVAIAHALTSRALAEGRARFARTRANARRRFAATVSVAFPASIVARAPALMRIACLPAPIPHPVQRARRVALGSIAAMALVSQMQRSARSADRALPNTEPVAWA